jgi:hypothetical protein
MWRRCGQTWCDTWRIAAQYNPRIVMIDTWNDLEEGTDIEFGTGECLTPSRKKCAPPGGGQVVYTHTLANSGKFTDTFNVKVHSSTAWPTMTSLTRFTLVGHASTTVAITLTVPETVSVGAQDMLVVTATSQLSPNVQSSAVDTTTACGCFLPLVLKDFIETSGSTDVHSRIADANGVWTGFPFDHNCRWWTSTAGA